MTSVDVLVEQAIARGERHDDIVAQLDVVPSFVRAVWCRMEALNCEADVIGTGNAQPSAQHGTHSSFGLHRKRGESPCEPCRLAEREYQANYKRQRQAS